MYHVDQRVNIHPKVEVWSILIAPVGTVRRNAGDIGAMHAIGTRVLFDSRTTVGYAMNNKVLQPVLKSFVEALLSVVQHMEADTSLLPISPINGNGIGLCVGYTIDTSVDLRILI